jgi:hypothetical protein
MYLPCKNGQIQTSAPGTPHVPIYSSPLVTLANATRVIIVFGESTQDLGVLAHRIAGGPYGINAGSMVNVVRSLLQQTSSAEYDRRPAIVLANTGQLCWWPEGKRALCRTQFNSAPMRSAVHIGRFFHLELNGIPENRTVREHIDCVLSHVMRTARADAQLDVISVADAAEGVEAVLDNEANWAAFGRRMHTLSLLGSYFPASKLQCKAFKNFLRDVCPPVPFCSCVL